ncbi:MAG: hypothetical protein V1913_07850 [Fibrobacterota bacterium]
MSNPRKKVAAGLKYFWLNYLGRELQGKAFRFLTRAASLGQSISFNEHIRDFRRVLVLLPDNPYEILLTQKSLIALKDHHPDMTLDVIAESVNRDVVKSNPCIDNGYFYSKHEYLYNHISYRELIRTLKERNYQACFIFKQDVSPLDLIVAAQSGAPLRVGFAGGDAAPFLNLTVRPRKDIEYEGDKYESLVRTLGVRTNRSRLKWDIAKTTERDVEGLLVEAGYRIDQPLIGLNISPGISGRSLPPDLIIRLAMELRKNSNAEIILFHSGAREAADVKELEELNRHVVPISEDKISFAAAFVYKCDLIVSLNNLIYQLAIILDRPVVGLFENLEHRRWALFQAGKAEIVNAARLRNLRAEDVLAGVSRIQSSTKA